MSDKRFNEIMDILEETSDSFYFMMNTTEIIIGEEFNIFRCYRKKRHRNVAESNMRLSGQ